MSEEILKALTQLFAILSKQDYGTSSNERNFVVQFFKEELDQDSVEAYLQLYDKLSGFGSDNKEKKRTSVSDSVRTLGICRKINKTLTQKQKLVVLVKIMELITSDEVITPTEREILNTVAEVFNFQKEEYDEIENFVFYDVSSTAEIDSLNTLIASREKSSLKNAKYQHLSVDGNLIFIRVSSENMYFLRNMGNEELFLNGFLIKRGQTYLFSNGSSIKTNEGEAVYFSELIALFNEELEKNELSFEVDNIEFKFPNGNIGLRNISISENQGRLIGIMGSSGAGKTTLLNVLAGLESPTSGSVLINGINIHQDKKKIQGIIGYVAQDDLLIEDLTVFQNLYYNAKLCFGNLMEEEIKAQVERVLNNLGLSAIGHLKVGSPLNKKISGGQRKRLNIALELIREPAVLFVDEPTSGLSSRDSENVIDLLKELSFKGKLIFVVIHQPSSEIYKMFDKMYILDVGGYPAYYGDPVEAVAYFKEASLQVDKNKGICTHCGNVNPEQIFNIIDAKVVDEYGQETPKRKMKPEQWYTHFIDKVSIQNVKEVLKKPDSLLKIQNKFKQILTFTTRDFLSKISNRQYLMLNLTEAPLLAIILTWISKYTAIGQEEYLFRFNDNMPIFFLMSVVVSLFLGLTVSAEEILRDKKILKRESFLNLSWNSYLVSKLILLFSLSAIQTFTFVVISVWVLDISSMFLYLWLVLFSVACFANVVGLVISAAFNSAVTVYILIPIILIPQMILSGLMFPYDKLNDSVASKTKVPLVADLMTSRWAIEAISVYQFSNNPYEAPFYKLNKILSESDFRTSIVVPDMESSLKTIRGNYQGDNSQRKVAETKITELISEIKHEGIGLSKADHSRLIEVNAKEIRVQDISEIALLIDRIRSKYQDKYNSALDKKEKLIYFLENKEGSTYNLNAYKSYYYNEQMSKFVKNANSEVRFVVEDGRYRQLYDAIYVTYANPKGSLNYRTQFYAAEKPFFGIYIGTSSFNLAVIWIMTILTYLGLYLNILPKILNKSGNLFINILNKIKPIK